MTRAPLALHLTLLLALLVLPAGAGELAGDLARALEQARSARFSVLVVEAGRGQEVFAHQADRPLVPASNVKLLTTAAALDLLGPDFAHETRLVLASPPREGVVAGDLWVVGGGDPTISRRFDPEPLLDDWAAAVAAAGVRRIEGAVVADDRVFEGPRLHPGWDPDDAEHWYGAEVGGLSLNDNCVDVAVAGGPDGPVVTLRPDTAFVRVEDAARPTDRQREHRFALLRTGPDRRVLRLTGRIWRRAGPYEASVPVADPGLYFATVLREALLRRGVEVVGDVRRAGAAEPAPAGPVVHRRLAPLLRTLEVTNQRSQNLYAECLLRTLGRLEGAGLTGAGTWERGAARVTAHALACGAPADQVRLVDGSGLARDNQLSARALVAVLRRATAGPHGAAYLATLAAPGEEGTLRRRLASLPAGVRLRAKTGTLTGVAALSGHLAGPDGRAYLFAVIGNGGDGGALRRAADAVVERLAAELTGRN